MDYHPQGYAEIDLNGVLQEPRETVLKLLSTVLQNVSGSSYPVRFEKLKAVLECCLEGSCHRTLGGCELILEEENSLFIYREAAAIAAPHRMLPETGAILWDGRFLISNLGKRAAFEVRVLGKDGWAHLKTLGHDAHCPFRVGITQPSLWQQDILCAVPTLGYYNPDRGCDLEVRFSPRIGAFGLVNLDLGR